VTTIEALNTLTVADFVARLGGIFEHSPWVAERVAATRPFASRDALLEAMCAVVDVASLNEQMALIRAHPQLGARGRQRAALTEASAREQKRAGLDACSDEEFAELLRLNALYVEKFTFPFILAVKGHDPSSILANFTRRLNNDPETERRTALQQIGRIAGHRLADIVT
jgi:OHCU decarboxylase